MSGFRSGVSESARYTIDVLLALLFNVQFHRAAVFNPIACVQWWNRAHLLILGKVLHSDNHVVPVFRISNKYRHQSIVLRLVWQI